ncbi:putative high-affinity glucose transporter [Clavispora lusitaniae]|uniref:High-affinity glucose transporter n=1 Tax=Clavispora lusitaniae TaxID=36911 RepID=A0AA91T1I3_CLALS|nr:putative high-affinity glucose transporter [Clavispora lusitaniae]
MSQSISSTEKITEKVASQPDSAEVHSVSVGDYIAETRPWYKVKHLRFLSFCIFVITISSTNNGYDGSMLNGLQSLSHWQKTMGHPTGKRLGHLSNGTLFGAVAALPFVPYFSDRFGRKKVIYVGQILAVVGGILQGVSNGYGFFLVSRIILGLGTGLASTPSPALISELSYPTHRETCTFAFNICWYLGAIIASWVTYGTRNIHGKASWSLPSYLQAAMPAIQVCLLWMVPESPRYLVARGRVEDARKVIAKLHTGNSTDPRDEALVDFELREIECALEAERMNTNVSYFDFIKKKSFRRRLFLVSFVPVMMQLSGNGLVSYYLVKVLISIGIKSTKKQLEINGCLMIYNFVICATMASTVRFFKRRTMFLTCVSGMLLSYVIWTVLSALNQQRDFKDKSLANGVLAMIFFFYLFYDIGMNGLPFLYLTEVLPYSHRTMGLNIMQFWTTGILIYNGYVNAIAMDAIEWKYYIVYCCILAVELVVVFFTFPETSGYTLEEVAQVFGDEPPELNKRHADNVVEKQSVEHVEVV